MSLFPGVTGRKRSIARLPLYRNLGTVLMDTTDLDAGAVAAGIAARSRDEDAENKGDKTNAFDFD